MSEKAKATYYGCIGLESAANVALIAFTVLALLDDLLVGLILGSVAIYFLMNPTSKRLKLMTIICYIYGSLAAFGSIYMAYIAYQAHTAVHAASEIAWFDLGITRAFAQMGFEMALSMVVIYIISFVHSMYAAGICKDYAAMLELRSMCMPQVQVPHYHGYPSVQVLV